MPVVCRPYKTTQADREEIHKIVTDWKRCGVVSETTSPYASPVLLVKQSGNNRLCVYYRRLNKQTTLSSKFVLNMFYTNVLLIPTVIYNIYHLLIAGVNNDFSPSVNVEQSVITQDIDQLESTCKFLELIML